MTHIAHAEAPRDAAANLNLNDEWRGRASRRGLNVGCKTRAAAGSLLPTQPRSGKAKTLRSFPENSGCFRSLFKKIMKTSSFAQASACAGLRRDKGHGEKLEPPYVGSCRCRWPTCPLGAEAHRFTPVSTDLNRFQPI
jgi:hypothetical protein